jgi:hypothetical protein
MSEGLDSDQLLQILFDFRQGINGILGSLFTDPCLESVDPLKLIFFVIDHGGRFVTVQQLEILNQLKAEQC